VVGLELEWMLRMEKRVLVNFENAMNLLFRLGVLILRKQNVI
jgi:hypothetical protein